MKGCRFIVYSPPGYVRLSTRYILLNFKVINLASQSEANKLIAVRKYNLNWFSTNYYVNFN